MHVLMTGATRGKVVPCLVSTAVLLFVRALIMACTTCHIRGSFDTLLLAVVVLAEIREHIERSAAASLGRAGLQCVRLPLSCAYTMR